MRTSVLAGLAAVSMFLAVSAQAVPVYWDLQSTITRTNLPALGPIEPGDVISASLVVETDTAGTPAYVADGYTYLDVFNAFDLSVNGHTLSLGPQSADPMVARTNMMATANFGDRQMLAMYAYLLDGDTPYAVELHFEFADLAAFPVGSLPMTPPSLASAILTDFALYIPPGDGSLLFVAGGGVDRLSVSSQSVPEPTTFGLLVGGMGMLALARRRRVAAASGRA